MDLENHYFRCRRERQRAQNSSRGRHAAHQAKTRKLQTWVNKYGLYLDISHPPLLKIPQLLKKKLLFPSKGKDTRRAVGGYIAPDVRISRLGSARWTPIHHHQPAANRQSFKFSP